MKNTTKIIIWSGAGIGGIIIIALVVFLLNFILATRDMTPADTAAINDSVWVVKDKYVNAFIFQGRSGYLMVDAGIDENRFSKELAKTGIKPDEITNLLLTHTDADHIGSTGLYKNAAIYMHRDEERMINGTTGKFSFYKPHWKFGPYKLLNSNDSLTLDGLQIIVLHTPGHTPGSVCYIVNGNYLVSGDNLIVKEGKYEHFVDKFNMNTSQQNESIRNLPVPSTFRYILTAHYGIVKVR